MIDPLDFDDLPDEVLNEISNPDFDWEEGYSDVQDEDELKKKSCDE